MLIDVYILTRDRPEKLNKALKAIGAQSLKDINIYVSDNSEKLFSETLEIVNNHKGHKNNIIYKKRHKIDSLWSHIKLCATESCAPFIVLLHDDDIPLSNYFDWIRKKVVQSLELNTSKFSAYAPNSIFSVNNNIINSLRRNNEKYIISTTDELLNEYFSIKPRFKTSAFPSYLYTRTNLVAALQDELEFGIYSDIHLLFRMLEYGKIEWDSEIAFEYCIHDQNMSSTSNFVDRRKILTWIKINKIKFKKRYREWLCFELIKLTIKNSSSNKEKYYLRRWIKHTFLNNPIAFTSKTITFLSILTYRALNRYTRTIIKKSIH